MTSRRLLPLLLALAALSSRRAPSRRPPEGPWRLALGQRRAERAEAGAPAAAPVQSPAAAPVAIPAAAPYPRRTKVYPTKNWGSDYRYRQTSNTSGDSSCAASTALLSLGLMSAMAVYLGRPRR